ncbi:hypothetical protein DFH27DRAFT_614471 [Peziza echinospora]|nr:hypothetical protein DFH27DRAFT_614471 [Peziza echinospora]
MPPFEMAAKAPRAPRCLTGLQLNIKTLIVAISSFLTVSGERNYCLQANGNSNLRSQTSTSWTEWGGGRSNLPPLLLRLPSNYRSPNLGAFVYCGARCGTFGGLDSRQGSQADVEPGRIELGLITAQRAGSLTGNATAARRGSRTLAAEQTGAGMQPAASLSLSQEQPPVASRLRRTSLRNRSTTARLHHHQPAPAAAAASSNWASSNWASSNWHADRAPDATHAHPSGAAAVTAGSYLCVEMRRSCG